MWKGFMHNTIDSLNSRSLSRNNMTCNKGHSILINHNTLSVVSINICSNCSSSSSSRSSSINIDRSINLQ